MFVCFYTGASFSFPNLLVFLAAKLSPTERTFSSSSPPPVTEGYVQHEFQCFKKVVQLLQMSLFV